MLDLFTIFSKGGIVLWCFQGTAELLSPSVNALIKSVILQERSGTSEFTHQALTLKHKLDNEFELIFVVAYQKILQLSYIDKFLDDIQLEFRDRYKNSLLQSNTYGSTAYYNEFDAVFESMLKSAERSNQKQITRPMRTFEDSAKSKKTVSSMVEKKGGDTPKTKKNKAKPSHKNSKQEEPVETVTEAEEVVEPATNGELDEQTRLRNLEKLMQRGKKGGKGGTKKSAVTLEGKRKKATVWEHAGTKKDQAALDYSDSKNNDTDMVEEVDLSTPETRNMVGKMKGNLGNMEESSDEDVVEATVEPELKSKKDQKSSAGGFGMFNMFKGLVGSKTVSREDLEPVIAKMQEHLVAKNVAADIAGKLCDSVASKLEGKVLGTFSTVASTVRSTLEESCVQILSPRRRVDILRDALDAKDKRRPYVITFCGVNGVGKSTNLAKIAFWLIENNLRVLVAGCDTFRAGAVEQLRTHERHLNSLHPAAKHGGSQMVKLYEKGYGKDPAGIAMEAINFARDQRFDVVLVDTAGRMQDNEPLMRALAKLIHVNQPDLVLFVGEALVGNEAVDQLVKFNQALADHSQTENPRLIDGIVLTKFDTIDDKVGAAVSMTYTTGQPIVFVGTGQTYTDLKNLNAKAVVKALMKA